MKIKSEMIEQLKSGYIFVNNRDIFLYHLYHDGADTDILMDFGEVKFSTRVNMNRLLNRTDWVMLHLDTDRKWIPFNRKPIPGYFIPVKNLDN